MSDTRRLIEIEAWAPADADGPVHRPYRRLAGRLLRQPPFATIAETARAAPDKPALVGPAGTTTYRELVARVERLAARLWAKGRGSTDPALFFGPQGPLHVLGVIAAMRAGMPYVALDPAQSALRNQTVAYQSGAAVLVCESADLAAAARLFPAERILVADDLSSQGGDLPPWPDLESPAGVVYTSGSTGVPKGVVHTHRGLLSAAATQIDTFHLNREDVLALIASPVVQPTFSRAVMTLLAEAAYLPIGDQTGDIASILAAHRPTVVAGYSGLLRALAAHPRAPEAFAAVRILHTMGEQPRRRDLELLWPVLPKDALIRLNYATTETRAALGWYVSPSFQPDGDRLPSGWRMPDSRLWIEQDEDLAEGAPPEGELLVAGDAVATGYWRAGPLTAERFMAHPTEPGLTMYRTGDVARLRPDGLIDIVGRRDNQVKIRGWRIELEEIEAAAMRLPGVSLAGAAPRRNPAGDVESLTLHYAAPAQSDATEEAMTAHLRAALPRPFWPARTIRSARLPLVASGKIDRPRLAELDALQAERESPAGEARDGAAWPDPLQRRVAEAIRAELGATAMPPDDNFVDLGGDSLQALNAALRIEKVFGVTIDPAELLGEETIGAVVARIAGSVGAMPAGTGAR